MVTDAAFVDLDNDTYKDLVVVGEFMGITVFKNIKGTFVKDQNNALSTLKGWWNTLKIADLDNDGKQDLILGNHGLNSRFKASKTHPIKLFVNDFDKNGSIDPVLSFTAENKKQYPYALRHNLVDQLKYLSKKYPDYNAFKSASIQDIFTAEQLQQTTVLEVNTLTSIIAVNTGNFTFNVQQLPKEAQFSPVYAIETLDADKDGDLDIILGGNLDGVKPEFGRYDASFGTYLENTGNLKFNYSKTGKGMQLKGQVRDIKALKTMYL
jgi:hypothetical protein